MKHFEIVRVMTGADGAEYVNQTPVGGELQLVQTQVNFTEVTIRFWQDFDWKKDSEALRRKLQAATELNDE
jgi:hypothetical protein